ncbi:MAG: hypothetical protein KAS32_11990 [Candidatus Peribacteraceae bacterium]|nr:hypothetical protein [Candidatus Peribacteraceae bacterium]
MEVTEEAENTIIARLQRYGKNTNVLTYEGTLQDQLCLNFVENTWGGHRYEVICSTRPCMSQRLQNDVASFASANGFIFLPHIGDCEIDDVNGKFIKVCCDNVRDALVKSLSGKNGLLVQGSVMDEYSRTSFIKLNSDLHMFECHDSSPVVKPGYNTETDWDTLFLFDGFSITDLILLYIKRVSQDIENLEIPICYLLCYNERQQIVIRDIIRTILNMPPFAKIVD